nr:hypothetical protein [Tanacetum cinerariifolium]
KEGNEWLSGILKKNQLHPQSYRLKPNPRIKGKGIMVEEPKPLKKKQQIEIDEEYARKLHAELNKDIYWDVAIDHVKLKAKEDPANVAGFRLDYFKGMSYDEIRPIFEAKFNSNVDFLLKTKEQIEEEESRALQRINETPTERAAKRRKLDEEVEDLKRHLEIVADEDDDVYTEATPLARKKILLRLLGRDSSRVVLAFTSFFFFCMSSAVNGLHTNLRIQLPPTSHNAHVEDIVVSRTAIARIFLYPGLCNLPGSGFTFLLAVATFFTGSTGKTQGSNRLEDVRHKENKSVILHTYNLNGGKLHAPFQIGIFRETLTERTKGGSHLGPKRPQVYSDLYTEEKDRVVVQNVQGRLNRDQENNLRGGGAAGVGNANLGQARQIKCYNYNGIRHIARSCTQPKRLQNFDYFKDKMLLMQAQENGVALDEEQLLFLADDCNTFDYDVNEVPMAQTMFMANLSSADPVSDEAGLSYDSDILSEVHDHDHYQDAVCEHHEEHEMHDNVQPNHVVESHGDYTSDSNMIPYDKYVKDNAVPRVQSNVSSIPNDAYMMIYNDIYEPHAQSVSKTSRNTVVDNSLTAELATYKEQVELYERLARFDLTEREKKINEQLRIVITDCIFKEETLKKELHSVKSQLASTINHKKSTIEEVTSLKKDFKQKENKYLEEFLDMKSIIQTRPVSSNSSHVPALYNGHEIIKNNHVPTIVHNTEDTLKIAEITRRKMNDKMKDPECVKHKMKAEPLKEQTTTSRPIKALMVFPPNIPATLVPRVLPTKSLVKINIFTLIQLFSEFDKTCKKRITPTGLTKRERGFEQTKEYYLKEVIPFFKTLKEHFESIQKALTKEIKEMKDVFDELEAEVDQNAVNRKHDEIERKKLLIANDNLIAECLSKEVFYVAMNSELNVSRFNEMHVTHTIVEARCLELEAELSNLRDKIHNDNHNELVNQFSNLEVKDKQRKGQNRNKTEQKREAWKSPAMLKVPTSLLLDPACCDDDDDSAITPNEPVNSLSMGDEHLDTIPATESDKFIKSCVENLVPNPSESEGENGCDLPACFTTFSNILFDADYESNSSGYQLCSDEDFLEKIYSNPLFEEEIIPMKIDQHHFNVESDLIESMLNHDSSIIPSSSKIDSLLDEFVDELTLLKSIPTGIDETDYHPENEIRFSERLLYDNSSPRPPKEFVYENSDAETESFSPSPIPNEDSDSFMEKIDLSFNPDDLTYDHPCFKSKKSPDLLSHRGLKNFLSAKCPMMIHGKNIPILDVPLFYFYPLINSSMGELGQAQRPKTSASWEAPNAY